MFFTDTASTAKVESPTPNNMGQTLNNIINIAIGSALANFSLETIGKLVATGEAISLALPWTSIPDYHEIAALGSGHYLKKMLDELFVCRLGAIQSYMVANGLISNYNLNPTKPNKAEEYLDDIKSLLISLNIAIETKVVEGKAKILGIDTNGVSGIAAFENQDDLLIVMAALAEKHQNLFLTKFIYSTQLYFHAPVGFERNSLLESMNCALDELVNDTQKMPLNVIYSPKTNTYYAIDTLLPV